MVVHASLPETGATALSDAMTGSETLIGPDGQNRSNLLSSFHRVPDLHCKMASPSSMIPNQQRCPINTMFDSKFPTVPASYVPNQLTAAALAAAASRANNPLWLAAALGMQAGSPIPWMTSPQMLASVFPYLQQIQAQAQQAAIAQQILAAQQSGSIASPPQVPTSVPTTPPAMNAVVQQLPQQWLSPPPSAAPMPIQTSSSPQLLSGGESPSTLSDLSDFSPRPCSDVISPPKVPSSSPTSSFLDPDLLLDAIIEERKDLSEEESIAVAVLAGMAYQR
ncbi:hypothetical protein AB6A40_001731 [Gnathostoma spinigerum]|uniref:Uncharacterized protein n=1 Tax=Gnathostoma spinigerum TaxID=75299 RepID=A0ABD6EES1_9BILA